VALFKIFETSIISVMKVDWFFVITSQLQILANIQSARPIFALSDGTKKPQ
jgi:hypothetical protein